MSGQPSISTAIAGVVARSPGRGKEKSPMLSKTRSSSVQTRWADAGGSSGGRARRGNGCDGTTRDVLRAGSAGSVPGRIESARSLAA